MNKLIEKTIKRMRYSFPWMEYVKLDKWLRRDIDLIDPTVFIMYSTRTNLYELHAVSSLELTGVDKLSATYQVSFKDMNFDLISYLYKNSVRIKSFDDRIGEMDDNKEAFEREKKAEQKLQMDYLKAVGKDNLKI